MRFSRFKSQIEAGTIATKQVKVSSLQNIPKQKPRKRVKRAVDDSDDDETPEGAGVKSEESARPYIKNQEELETALLQETAMADEDFLDASQRFLDVQEPFSQNVAKTEPYVKPELFEETALPNVFDPMQEPQSPLEAPPRIKPEPFVKTEPSFSEWTGFT